MEYPRFLVSTRVEVGAVVEVVVYYRRQAAVNQLRTTAILFLMPVPSLVQATVIFMRAVEAVVVELDVEAPTTGNLCICRQGSEVATDPPRRI